MVLMGHSIKGTSMNKFIDKLVIPIHKAARSMAEFLGGGRSTMIGGIRVYLWPFVMVAIVLILSWGADMLFFQ